MRLPKHRLFDYNTPGKGVSKDEPPKKGIALFGDILLRRFWKMVSLNFLYFLFSIPALIIMWFMIYVVLTFFFSGLMADDPQLQRGVTQICMCLTCVVYALFGGGAPTAAMTYVLRNYREDRHSWVWADFKEKLFENFKQGTAVFAIDMVFIFLLSINYWFYSVYAASNIAAFFLQGLMAVLFLIFLLMHAYIYPIMISFDMKIRDIYKKSFLLAIGKLPTTFFSMILCVIFCSLIAYLACFVMIYAVLVIPIIMFAFTSYLNLFITYPVIKRYLVKSEDN